MSWNNLGWNKPQEVIQPLSIAGLILMLDEFARGSYFTVTSPGAEAKQSNDVFKLIQSLAIICFVVLSKPALPCTPLEIASLIV